MFRHIKNTLIYHFTRVAVTLTSFIPARFTRSAGRIIGSIAFVVAGKERAIARKQLSMAFNRPENGPVAKLLTRGVFLSLGQSVVELCRLFRLKDKPPTVIIPDSSRKCLDDALSFGKGVVFVTGHLGNWELMAFSLATMGYPISTVAKESYDARFTTLIEKFRGAGGVRAIYRGQPGAPAAMLRTLKNNRVLGFLIDQDTRVPSEFVPFFKREAHTPIGAATFAIRSGAPTVVGSISRNRNNTHTVDISECCLSDDVVESTARLTKELERRIRKSPSQWVWFHKRWKTRPLQETNQ